MDTIDMKWWRGPDYSAHKRLAEFVQNQRGSRTARIEQLRRNTKLYENKAWVPIMPGESNNRMETLFDPHISLNVCHMTTTALMNKVCVSYPKPDYLTEGGTYEEKTQAKLRSKFVLGIMQAEGLYDMKSVNAFQECLLGDIGCLMVGSQKALDEKGEETERIFIERVPQIEIIVDEETCGPEGPREIVREKHITKEKLKKLYPEAAGKIESAESLINYAIVGKTDLVPVYEGWHLPTYPGAGDGKRIVCISNMTLELEPYERSSFPLHFTRFEHRSHGFYGLGMVTQQAPLQEYLNELVNYAKDGVSSTALNVIILDKHSKIVRNHFKKFPGIIIEKSGGPDPKIINSPGINPLTLQLIDFYYQKAFAIARLSEFAVTKDTQGLRTGAALRTLQNQDSEGIKLVINEWERIFLRLPELIMQEAKEIHDRGYDVFSTYCSRRGMEKIKFKDVGCPDDPRFKTKIHSTSMLPQSTTGKLALTEQLINMNFGIDQGKILELLDFPDVDKFIQLETSAQRNAERICEFILKRDGNWVPPEKFMKLDIAVGVAQNYWIDGNIEGIPKARLDRLAEWINMAMGMLEEDKKNQMMEQAQIQMEMQQMAQQQAPQAAPGVPEPAPEPGEMIEEQPT